MCKAYDIASASIAGVAARKRKSEDGSEIVEIVDKGSVAAAKERALVAHPSDASDDWAVLKTGFKFGSKAAKSDSEEDCSRSRRGRSRGRSRSRRPRHLERKPRPETSPTKPGQDPQRPKFAAGALKCKAKVYPSEQSRAISQSVETSANAQAALDSMNTEEGILGAADRMKQVIAKIEVRLVGQNLDKLIAESTNPYAGGGTLGEKGAEVMKSLTSQKEQAQAALDILTSTDAIVNRSPTASLERSPSFLGFALETAKRVGLAVHHYAKSILVSCNLVELIETRSWDDVTDAFSAESQAEWSVASVFDKQDHALAVGYVAMAVTRSLFEDAKDNADDATIEPIHTFAKLAEKESKACEITRNYLHSLNKALEMHDDQDDKAIDAALDVIASNQTETMAKISSTALYKHVVATAKSRLRLRAVYRAFLSEWKRVDDSVEEFFKQFPDGSLTGDVMVKVSFQAKMIARIVVRIAMIREKLPADFKEKCEEQLARTEARLGKRVEQLHIARGSVFMTGLSKVLTFICDMLAGKSCDEQSHNAVLLDCKSKHMSLKPADLDALPNYLIADEVQDEVKQAVSDMTDAKQAVSEFVENMEVTEFVENTDIDVFDERCSALWRALRCLDAANSFHGNVEEAKRLAESLWAEFKSRALAYLGQFAISQHQYFKMLSGFIKSAKIAMPTKKYPVAELIEDAKLELCAKYLEGCPENEFPDAIVQASGLAAIQLWKPIMECRNAKIDLDNKLVTKKMKDGKVVQVNTLVAHANQYVSAYTAAAKVVRDRLDAFGGGLRRLDDFADHFVNDARVRSADMYCLCINAYVEAVDSCRALAYNPALDFTTKPQEEFLAMCNSEHAEQFKKSWASVKELQQMPEALLHDLSLTPDDVEVTECLEDTDNLLVQIKSQVANLVTAKALTRPKKASEERKDLLEAAAKLVTALDAAVCPELSLLAAVHD